MKTSEIRRALRRRWPFTLAVIVLAIGVAVLVQRGLRTVPKGTATTQILVDSPNSSLLNVNVSATGLTSQAAVLAQAMTSRAVLQDVATAAGLPAGALSAQGPFNGAGEVLDIPTPSEARAMQVVSIKQTYHLAIVAQQNVPIITVTVQGPNPTAAGHVADSVLPGAEKWLASIAATTTLPKSKQLVLRQLGDAQAGEVNSHTSEVIAIVAAIAVIILGLLAVTLVDRRLGDRAEMQRRAGDFGGFEEAFDSDRPAPRTPRRYGNGRPDPSASAEEFDEDTAEDGEEEDARLAAVGAAASANGSAAPVNRSAASSNGSGAGMDGSAPQADKPGTTKRGKRR